MWSNKLTGDIYNKNLSKSYSTSSLNEIYMDPWFVTGFADGESCFYIRIYKSKGQLGWTAELFLEFNYHPPGSKRYRLAK
jgi:hypothetical protein